jgi:Protein of unknown function (DUF3098)
MKNRKQNENPVAVSPASVVANFADAKVTNEKSNESLPFSKGNYTMMLIGLAVIMAGFFIMTMDKEDFGFGFLGLTLGPIIAFIGFIIEFYAILKK